MLYVVNRNYTLMLYKIIFDQTLFLKCECYKYMSVLEELKCIAI